MTCRRKGDRGTVGIVCIALCAVAVVFVTLLAQVTEIAAARHRAAKAADLAALAAADAVRGLQPGDPCTTAGAVASKNHAALRSCTAASLSGSVKVVVAVTLPEPWPPLHRTAVAGPPTSPRARQHGTQ